MILDVAMPKKDGPAILKEIKKDNPQARVVIISASANTKLESDCMQAGALAFISKPFAIRNVLTVLDKIA